MSNLKSKLAAGVFAISSIFAAQAQTSANDDKLIAMNEPVKTEIVNETVKPVGVLNWSDKELHNVQYNAGRISKGSIVILYMGSDKALATQVREGATAAKASGVPIKGMVLGPADPDFHNGEDSVIIIVDGYQAYDQYEAWITPKTTTKKILIDAKDSYAEKLGLAKVVKPAESQLVQN